LAQTRWYAGLALLLISAIAVMGAWDRIERVFSGPSKEPVPSIGNQTAAGTPSGTSGQVAPSEAIAELSRAKSMLDEASTNASEALTDEITWQTEIEPLRDQVLAEPTASNGESGEADSTVDLFDRLAYVMGKDRANAEDLHQAVNEIDSLRIEVDERMKQSNPDTLSPSKMAEISRLHANCKQAQEDWHRDVEQAQAIVHLLSPQISGRPAAPATVGSKLEEAEAKAAVKDVDRQMARDEEEQAAREARAAELEQQRQLKDQQEAELLAKATSPEVRILLAPFLKPRTIQPSLSGTLSIRWIETGDKKPMSLGSLQGIGALDSSTAGLQKLALVAGNRKLPEPKWSVSSQPHQWSEEDQERLKKAQQMLRDYGAVLVKAKQLSE
jgi:hypothetical protein